MVISRTGHTGGADGQLVEMRGRMFANCCGCKSSQIAAFHADIWKNTVPKANTDLNAGCNGLVVVVLFPGHHAIKNTPLS